ncbi:MAG: TlpA disulfide reductase family protein [Rhodospirillales bacterium]
MSRLTGSVFSIVLILAISVAHSSLEAQTNSPVPEALKHFKAAEAPKPAPQTPFLEGEATRRTLADYKGKGIVLNFWATWCAPCIKEMPQLDKLQTLSKDKGVVVLTVSEDRGAAAMVEKFLTLNNLKNLPPLRDPEGALMRRFGIRGLPTTILIDAQGNDVGRVVGPAEWDNPEVVAFIHKLIGTKRP